MLSLIVQAQKRTYTQIGARIHMGFMLVSEAMHTKCVSAAFLAALSAASIHEFCKAARKKHESSM